MAHLDQDIVVDIIGDSGPFSLIGKSIGYRLQVNGQQYLVDCGAPVFQLLGIDGIQTLRGIVATHSHEDHRRWFTDIALFKFYTPGIQGKLRLITSATIHEEFHKNSRGALERSLSPGSRYIVDMSYNQFVEKCFIGPTPRYSIQQVRLPGEQGLVWRALDADGQVAPPHVAKVVINPEAPRPRLLFRDPPTGMWIEPEIFYPFSNRDFYFPDNNLYTDHAANLTIEAMKEPAWHGPPTIALRFTCGETRLVFSSDTVYDPELWRSLVEERRTPRLGMSPADFESSPLVVGDINEFVAQTWSRARYETALAAYADAVIIHDVDYNGSAVHTSYGKIAASRLPQILLTHSPDNFASQMPLAASEKSFRVRGHRYAEITEHGDFPMDAACYFKENGSYFVGYPNPEGGYAIVPGKRCMQVKPRNEVRPSEIVGLVDLYQDLRGGYYPRLGDELERYHLRPDGKVERQTYACGGSAGVIVEDQRPRLSQR